VRHEAIRSAEGEPEQTAAGTPPRPATAEPAPKAPDERIAELTRALAATREREGDFRQAAFDLNTELLRKDAEIETLRNGIAAADAQAAELQRRVTELENLFRTRAFRIATSWWRLKAAIFRQ
jgi:chromosome segregation ATPase